MDSSLVRRVEDAREVRLSLACFSMTRATIRCSRRRPG